MLSDLRQKIFQLPSGIILSVGLCWEFLGAAPVDLDLSAVCFSREGQFLDVVFFNHLFPQATNEKQLSETYKVNQNNLPYMFLSGDSRIGGEEENRMSVDDLSKRRRKGHFGHRTGKRNVALTMENLFSRLYAEEELQNIQEVIDHLNVHGGEAFNEDGHLVHYTLKQELPDEVLTFVLDKIPNEVGVIFITISNYNGLDMSCLQHARLVITNETTGKRVGVIKLDNSHRKSTANLAAMFLRVPPESNSDTNKEALLEREILSNCWDLRELNLHTFGYTFVDMIPLMLDVMNIPQNSRLDALQRHPNYDLAKSNLKLSNEPLLNLRFGVGWDGAHDLDAFLVMFDDAHNYVDHVYPKQGKLHSLVANLARHSGDALSGNDTDGDVEFIDFKTFLVPSNVQTILVGASYARRDGDKKDLKSIYDVPNAYLRLQNRTWYQPQSFEVDRWDLYKEYDNNCHPKTKDAETHPTRTLLLGLLVKTGSAERKTMLPDPLNETSQETSHDPNGKRDSIMDKNTDRIPLFTYIAVHQLIPVAMYHSFGEILPFLRWTAFFLEESGRISGILRHLSLQRGEEFPRDDPQLVRSEPPSEDNPNEHSYNRLVVWDHNMMDYVGGRAAPGLEGCSPGWQLLQREGQLTVLFAVEVHFLEVLSLMPRMPDRFRCHVEAWVHSEGLNSFNGVYKSSFLGNPENLSWGTNCEPAVFLVHKYDSIRVLLYEHAAVGQGDIDLLHTPGLWESSGQNIIEIDLPLMSGSPLFEGKIRLCIQSVPFEFAYTRILKRWKRTVKRQAYHHEKIKKREDQKQNHDLKLCAIM
ncbi:unnamed protein product [Phytomonas sp. Hart1]|nr:unnamed protein product [Phytomonas sp. Hart1]|eukprot:CCW71995.1 unnamed protein product [Phytomonas sp. isolate Hart1]